jgi:hypothetical protein
MERISVANNGRRENGRAKNEIEFVLRLADRASLVLVC